MVIAALALNRLSNEGRNVVRVLRERSLRLAQSVFLRSDHLVQMIAERVDDRRHVDPRPVELGESVRLVGFSVGQRQGVATAAMKGACQMHDLGTKIGIEPGGFVLPALPVKGDLEGILDRQRATFDEEQMRQRGIAEHAYECLDELGVVGAVHVRIRRLIDSDLGKLGHERRIICDAGRIEPQRSRCEEGVHVEVMLPGTGIEQPATSAVPQIKNELHSVGQYVPGKHLLHLRRLEMCLFGHGVSFPRAKKIHVTPTQVPQILTQTRQFAPICREQVEKEGESP